MKNKLIKLLLVTALTTSLIGATQSFVNAKNNDYEVSTASNVVIENSLGLFTASDPSVVSFEKNAKAPEYFFNNINPYTANGVISRNNTVYGKDDALGLKVNFTDDVTLNYASPVYIGELASSVPVIEFLVTPEKNDTHKQATSETYAEFGGVEVTLTDFYDADRYVTFDIIYSTAYTWRSEAKIASKDMTFGGNRWGGLNVATSFGTPVMSSFTGAINHTQSYYFDTSTNVANVSPNYRGGEDGDRMWMGNNAFMRDLDDPAWLIKGDTPFAGFTNDVVNVSIKFKGVTASKASVILLSLCGQDLRGEEVVDATPPTIIENKTLTENPSALVGERFYVNEVSAFDAVSGILSDEVYIEVYKDYTSNNKTPVALKGNYFIPETAGEYTILYGADDEKGNKGQFKRVITAYDKLSDITVEYANEFTTSATIGDEIEIPSYVTYGGAGCVESEFEIINKKTGENYYLTGGKLLVDKEGVYEIKVSCVDYIGQKYTSVKYIDVKAPTKPVISLVNVPKACISGKHVYFPTVYATDYTLSDNPSQIVCDVLVKENDGEWVKVENSKHKVTANNGTLKVKFVAESIYSNASSESDVYEIKIVNLETCASYFYSADGSVTVDYVLQENGFNEEALFKASTNNASMEYVNSTSAKAFNVDFVAYVAESGYTNFGEVIITIRDSANLNEKVTVKLTQEESGMVFNIAGSQTLNASGNFKGETVNFSIKNGNQIYNGTKFLDTIKKFDNGVDFTGFSSGKIYTTFTFSKVTGNSGLFIRNLNGQTIFTKELFDGTAPIVNLSKEVSSTCALGSKVIVPSATSIDMFDPDTEVTVKVTSPSGKVLFTENANVERSFIAESFGEYVLSYSTKDDYFNSVSANYIVNCEDTFKPVIEINGQFSDEMALNSVLVIPEIKVTDNIGTDLTCYVFIETPTNYVENIEEQYVLNQKGKYILKFFAQDDSSNFTTLTFEIIVK